LIGQNQQTNGIRVNNLKLLADKGSVTNLTTEKGVTNET